MQRSSVDTPCRVSPWRERKRNFAKSAEDIMVTNIGELIRHTRKYYSIALDTFKNNVLY